MGTDKGLLSSAVVPGDDIGSSHTWAQDAFFKLQSLSIPVKISVNTNQLAKYSKIFAPGDLIADNESLKIKGPLCGVLSAHLQYPSDDLIILVYDILCAKDFNPNERTGYAFSTNNPKFLLAEQLRRAVLSYYRYHGKEEEIVVATNGKKEGGIIERRAELVFQCKKCLTVYDERIGDPENGIDPDTSFDQLPDNFCCSVCGDRFRIVSGILYFQDPGVEGTEREI